MDRPSRGFSIGGVDRVDKRLHPPRTIPTFDLSIEVPVKTPRCLIQVEPRPHVCDKLCGYLARSYKIIIRLGSVPPVF